MNSLTGSAVALVVKVRVVSNGLSGFFMSCTNAEAVEIKARPPGGIVELPAVALSQDFRKFAKKSKAGADQEKISKMAGFAEKNPGFLAILQ